MPVLNGVLNGVLGGSLAPFRAVVGGGSGADPAYTVTGPSGGVALAESTNFTVTGYNLTGPVVVSYTSDDPGDSFSTASVTIDVGDNVKTFTITPDGSIGIRTISFTNDSAITDQTPLEYEVTAVGGTDNLLLETGDGLLLEDGFLLLLE